jgi:CrcB protein
MKDINLTHAFAIALGATLGAWLRWVLGIFFNSVIPHLPLGTLIANLSGGLMMGIALGFFLTGQLDSQTMRLLITTGFLGGLTTFSAFSGEGLILLIKQEYGWVLVHTFSHVFGALLMAAVGYYVVQLIRT